MSDLDSRILDLTPPSNPELAIQPLAAAAGRSADRWRLAVRAEDRRRVRCRPYEESDRR